MSERNLFYSNLSEDNFSENKRNLTVSNLVTVGNNFDAVHRL